MKFKLNDLFKSKSIGSKLLSTFLSVAFIICLVLSLISTIVAKKALNNLLTSTLPEITEMSSAYIHETLETNKKVIENLALEENISSSKVSIDDKVKMLQKNIEINGFLRLGVADLNGNVKFGDSSANISEREYFKDALNGKSSVSNPAPSVNPKDNGAVVSVYASPINDENGKISSVLVAVEEAGFFSDIVKSVEIGKTGEAFVVDNDGATIADKDVTRIGTVNIKENMGTDPELDGFEEPFNSMISNEEGIEVYKSNGETLFLSYKNIKDTNWTLGIEIQKSEVLKDVKTIQIASFLAAILCLIIGSALIIYQVRGINKGLSEATNNLESMGKGDMSIEVSDSLINRNDELGTMGKAMNDMQHSVNSAIKAIIKNANNIENYSENLASISEEMSSSTDSVANSIQDVASGTQSQSEDMSGMVTMLDEFNNSIEMVMDAINEISEENVNIYTLSETSNEEMDKVILSVKNVNKAFRNLVEKVKSVEGNINKINDIITVINSIAEQTNLLALNAAIEAARVGENGKGFAVVADEIRKLAEQSKLSASDITKLLNNVFDETGIMVSTTEVVKDEIESQSDIINNAMDTFEKIKVSVDNMTPKIARSKHLGEEIIQSKEVINEKAQNVMSVSQEVSASSEEIAAIAEEMNASSEEVASSSLNLAEMTKTMKEEVQKFKVE